MKDNRVRNLQKLPIHNSAILVAALPRPSTGKGYLTVEINIHSFILASTCPDMSTIYKWCIFYVVTATVVMYKFRIKDSTPLFLSLHIIKMLFEIL